MPTQKYLIVLRSAGGKQEPPSPAQMQEMYAAFNVWKEKFKGYIVDMGGKLKSGGKILTASGVTDGPYAEAKEIIGGDIGGGAGEQQPGREVARGCAGGVKPGCK